MEAMAPNSELVEAPLTREELAARYRELCDDPRLENVPGKIEIDQWGRLLMSPATTYHGTLQAELCHRLKASLGGRVITEASVVTADRVMVADAAWVSDDFVRRHGFETPLTGAPEICVEVVSPSNSRRELEEKIAGYLATGAVEVWIVYPRSKRIEFHGAGGLLAQTSYAVDVSGLFD
jgi:Uma2 family endonuclease